MLTDLELMHIHLRALFTHNAQSRLLFINEPDGGIVPAPRLFLGRTKLGNVWRFRTDLPEGVIEELDSLCADEPSMDREFDAPPRHAASYLRLLEKHGPVVKVSSGPAYCFREDALSTKRAVALNQNDGERLLGGFEDLISELPNWQPFVALFDDNRAVSVCRSVRITTEAHEAGVETLPDFRGKGLAPSVTANWAERVKVLGAVPLYSASWTNRASLAVARKLGLSYYGSDFHIA